MSPSLKIGLFVSCKKAPAGWSLLLKVRFTWGASRTCLIEHRAVGLMLVGLFQPAGSLLKRTLDVN
jgi:hypothetical protein